MSFVILDLSQKEKWTKYLEKLPQQEQDIFFAPEYYELFERRGDGKAFCFVFSKDEDVALYPFLKNSINNLGLLQLEDEYFDIQGTYGYNGVLTSNQEPVFVEAFNSAFTDFCSEQKIIAEFTRFNPLLDNHNFSTYHEIIQTNKNVTIDLRMDLDEIRSKCYEQRARKSINKAKRNDVTVKCFTGKEIDDSWIKAFTDIYLSTMKRNQADDFFFFNEQFLIDAKQLLKNNSVYFIAFKEKIPVSCELVIFRGKIVYGFIGGTLVDYYQFNPNSLLKDFLIEKLKEMGFFYYSMGGWQTPYDGIYKYKRSFSKDKEYDFYIGKKIHNTPVYEKICQAWEIKNPDKVQDNKNILLKYRAG
ncbi:GNAT family N-acetyltransferase [candidate division KSB1 bacterium]|nr:GNAT family N-acetyltransferase [candidate division KSB1 bacterium]